MQFVLFLTLTAAAVGLTTAFDIDTYKNVVLELSSNPLYRQDFKSHLDYLLKLEPDYFEYTPFNRAGLNFTFDCKVDSMRSTTVPSSVHALRPGDVKVVGAMGDSITAALGANARTIPGILFEFRGRSWSIGGQSSLEKVVTMPNILKKFNPDLRGFSTHDDLSLVFRTGVGLNAAVSGQESNHIPGKTRSNN
jgi:phospholipase B1